MTGILSNMQQSSYNARKTMCQGLLDAALFLANATELKHCVDGVAGGGLKGSFGVAILSLSMIIQIVVGLLLIMILNIEGTIKQLTDATAVAAGTPLSEDVGTVEEVIIGPSDAVVDRKFVLVRRARRMNTAVLCFIFIVVCLNMISSGLGLSNPDLHDHTNNTT